MYKRILVPVDGSKLSESALPYAQQLAKAFDSEIGLVYAIESNHDVEIPASITEEAQQDAETYLDGLAASLPQELSPKYQVKHGNPAEVIINQAESNPDTLVVMATRGYTGLKRVLLGSVAHKVVQVIDTPILLIPAGAKSPTGGPVELRTAIIPLDGSELAELILPPIMEFCRALNLELILTRAYNPIFPGSSIRMHDISQIVHDAAENYVKEKAKELSEICRRDVKYMALRGVPAEQITNFAIETQNSLTAMCTHGRHGPGRWLLGSVTEAVISCSEEPVLVIRGTTKD